MVDSIYVVLNFQSLITVWGLIQGVTWFGLGISGFLANMFAGPDKPGGCCKYSWALLFWTFFLFHVGWWMTGNYWYIIFCYY